MTLADRVAGCRDGAAIGDALGSAFEFVDAATIRRLLREPFVWQYRASVSGSLLHPREPGRPTDDTAMALSVAGAISGGEPLTAALFARRFLTDLNCGTGRFGEMFWSGGPGGATTRALSRLRAGADQQPAATLKMVATARRCALTRSGSCLIAMRCCGLPRCKHV